MRQLTTDEKFWSDNKAASFQLKKFQFSKKKLIFGKNQTPPKVTMVF